MVLPKCVDLLRVAVAAEGDPRYRRLYADIQRALRVQSCAADLGQVAAILKAWEKLATTVRGTGSDERAATEAALLFTGVSLYVRATWSHTKKGDRGAINIESALSQPELADHCLLKDVRNKAFAHVYPKRIVGGDVWHDQLCIAVEQDAGWMIGGATRSTWNHGQAWQALRRQAPIASAILKRRFQEKADAITRRLNADGIAKSMLLRGLVDPVEVFGSLGAAERMMPGNVGYAFTSQPAARS